MTSEDIEKYMQRELTIDCPRMVLRNNAELPDRVYEGPGSIYQTPEGQLQFKLYSNGAPDYAAFAQSLGPNAPKAGEIIPRNEFFSLEATSLSGGIWHSEFIHSHLNQGTTRGPMVTGSLRELTNPMSDPHSAGFRPHLSLLFAEDFDFPGNAQAMTKTLLNGVETGMSGDWSPAVFEAAGLKFQLQKKGRSVSLSAQSNTMMLPQHLHMRICEALEFTLFEPERWVIRTVWDGRQVTTTLRPFPKANLKRTPRPPIGFRSRQTAESVWNLFAKYLEYVLTHPKPEWHPMSESVHLAVEGDAGSVDAGMLALAVAVEGVLKIGFPKLAAPDAFLLEQIDAACKLVTESLLDDSFKGRVSGALNAMRASRAKDKLLAVQKAGVIRPELVRAWEKTRHPSVHADGFDKTAIDKIYRNYQSALTLFNELVFLVVGYTGQYSDFSVVGWPLRAFEQTMKDVECVQELLVGPNAETHKC
jgi:hypothetical protein